MKKWRPGVVVVVTPPCGHLVSDGQSHHDQNRVVLLVAAVHGGISAPGFTGKPLVEAFAGEHASAAFAGV